jgi:hypothetical protein
VWTLVELDLHELYGIDVHDRELLHARPWRWLHVRIVGLLSTECRVQRVLNPTEAQKKAQEQQSD